MAFPAPCSASLSSPGCRRQRLDTTSRCTCSIDTQIDSKPICPLHLGTQHHDLVTCYERSLVIMRLMHVETRQLKEFFIDISRHAILSHTWGPKEVTFQDLDEAGHRTKLGYAKIEGCCRQAHKDHLQWVWIDICCIDKSSSAELSEAINSMFERYRSFTVYCIYLEDVLPEENPWVPMSTFRLS